MVRIEGSMSLQNGVWSLCTLRKATRCAGTGRALEKGDDAYRPLGNGLKRAQRLSVGFVAQHTGGV